MGEYNEFHKAKKPRKQPASRVRFVKAPKGERTFWSDSERMAALAAVEANGGNIHGTAVDLGIPPATLQCWVNGKRFPEGLRLRLEAKGQLADCLEDLSYQIAAILPSRFDTAPMNHLVQGLDKTIEKTRLLRGESTSNNDNRNEQVDGKLAEVIAKATPDERAKLRELLMGIAQRQQQQPGELSGAAAIGGGNAGDDRPGG